MIPNETVTAEIVCLVDADPSVLKSIGRLLISDGLTVRSFSEPRAYLASVEAHSAPLVILDIWREQMSGLEAQFALRRISPQTRVVVMTARSDPGVGQTALDAGAVAFFTKPFDDNEFLQAVRPALAAAA